MSQNSIQNNVIRRKLVIVGDGGCGKTSLLSVFTLGFFPKHYVPTVFESYVTHCRVDGRPVELALWDTAGQEDYERLRPFSYSRAHVILIGFSIDNPDSFQNVQNKWIEEVTTRCPGAPIILVGLKDDLRRNAGVAQSMSKSDFDFVTHREGLQMAQICGARKYMECSSLTGNGVDEVFEAATRAALLSTVESTIGGCCVIL